MRHRHPAEYNNELRDEAVNARGLWTEEEENEMAEREARCDQGLPVGAIIDHLMQYSTRSRESIRARRRQRGYAEKVRAFREQSIQERDELNDSNSDVNEDEIAAINGSILSSLSGMRDRLDLDCDVALLDGLIHQNREVAVGMLENWCNILLSQYKQLTNSRGSNQTSAKQKLLDDINRPGISRRKRRALEYRLAQLEYGKDQKSYANRLLDGTDCTRDSSMPNCEDIKNHYNEVFATPSAEDMERIRDKSANTANISDPILVEEVEFAIKSSKSNSPGPDGATLKNISLIPRIRLALLFNAMLLLETIPRALVKSRTILIPKTKENLDNVKNWRPLTISSIFLRVFNKILAQRISNRVELHGTQRGFSRIDGCFANCITLEGIIKARRKAGQPLTMITLDLSKAFDRVSHHSIKRALTRKNIDVKTVRIIMDNYRDATTTLSCNGQEVGTIRLNRGVKQGDPLSPVLFNMVIDELLCNIDGKGGVQMGDNTKLSALAYADDICLCSEDRGDAGRLLSATVKFVEKRGLEINVGKCNSLTLQRVPSKKKIFVDTEPYFKIGDEFIKPINIFDEFRYLGQVFSTSGLSRCSTPVLYEQLSAIRRAPLKPQQKMSILRYYLIPRYIASLQKPNASLRLLKEVDKKIRAFTRMTLHLPSHCSNSVFYAPLKLGGLGIFSFQSMIPVITRGRMRKLSEATPLLHATINLAQPIMERINRQIDPNIEDTNAMKRKLGEDLEGSYNGKGLNQAKYNKACRQFITHPPIYWNGEQYIKAIQLRYNVLPTAGIPSNPPEARMCRVGCRKVESLSHVLQNCPLTHWSRIKRHDYVLRRLTDAAKKHRWKVRIEPHIWSAGGMLKPDAILEKDNRVIITDVGVNWEGDISLSVQYEHKRLKYSGPHFIQRVQQLYPGKAINILPLVVGARGTWCSENRHLVDNLQLTPREVEDIINTALRGGWSTHSYFMRCVWRVRHMDVRRRRQVLLP